MRSTEKYFGMLPFVVVFAVLQNAYRTRLIVRYKNLGYVCFGGANLGNSFSTYAPLQERMNFSLVAADIFCREKEK